MASHRCWRNASLLEINQSVSSTILMSLIHFSFLINAGQYLIEAGQRDFLAFSCSFQYHGCACSPVQQSFKLLTFLRSHCCYPGAWSEQGCSLITFPSHFLLGYACVCIALRSWGLSTLVFQCSECLYVPSCLITATLSRPLLTR